MAARNRRSGWGGTKLGAAAIGALALVLLGPGTASADKCAAAKLRAIGRKERALLACQAKVALKGDRLEMACDDRAGSRFATAYDKPGSCGAPESSTCGDIADNCRDEVRAALPDGGATQPSKCEAARLRAAGRAAAAKLACYAKAAAKGGLDTEGCLATADAAFVVAFNKVRRCTGDGEVDAIGALIDAECVDPLVTVDGGGRVTQICPATTTTTATTPAATTTSSTTETTAPPTTTTTIEVTTTTASTTTMLTTSTETTTTITTTSTTTTPSCDVCSPGQPLDASCSPCVAAVCNASQDPSCCTDSWDALCVSEACTVCGAQCPRTPCAPLG